MASVVVAYALWFFLGIFGVHHFYLKRDRHAFVWWSTLGGFFLGWIRDIWHLPEYIEKCNEDEDNYVSDNNNDDSQNARREEKPRLSSARHGGMILMGYVFGYLVMMACPQEWYRGERNNILVNVFLRVVPPFAAAVGVHLVANIGRIQASFQWCLLGSFAGVIWTIEDPTNIGASCLLATEAVNWFGLSWKPSRRPRKSKCKRLTVLCACGTVYLLLWTSALYFNATVTTKDGEEVPLRVAINNFFTSPAWRETKEALHLVWQHIKVNGWRNVYQQFIEILDPQGEANAYKVLGVDSSTSQEEIKKVYKKLAREWHPDKQKDPAKKEEAQEKFMEIQQAYETLSQLKTRRSQQNKKSSKLRDEF